MAFGKPSDVKGTPEQERAEASEGAQAEASAGKDGGGGNAPTAAKPSGAQALLDDPEFQKLRDMVVGQAEQVQEDFGAVQEKLEADPQFQLLKRAMGLGGTPGQESEVDESAEGGTFAQRIVSKLGRSPEEQRRLLTKMLGSGFETKVDGEGEVLFRQKGAKKYQRLDPKGFGTVGELLKDLGADFAGDIVEGAIGGAGTAAGFAAAGPAGAVAGSAVGGGVGAGVRQSLIEAMGVTPTEDLESEVMMGAGLNVAFLGAGAAARTVLGKAAGIGRNALTETPMARVSEAADVLRETTELFEKHGLKLGADSRTVGERTSAALHAAERKLGEQVGIARKMFEERVNPSTDLWDVEEFVKRAESLFAERRVRPNADNPYQIPQIEVQRSAFAPNERAALTELASMYNKAQKNARRLTYDEIRQSMQKLDALADFDGQSSARIKNQLPAVRGALRADEHKIIDLALDGEDKEFYKTALKDFSDQIDDIRTFRAKFRQAGESGEAFVKKLIRKDRAEDVTKLKAILGENSEDFMALRGAWLESVFKDVRNDTGALDGSYLKQEIEKWGEPLFKEMLGEDGLRRLQIQARRAEKIPLADIKDPGAKQSVKDAAILALGSKLFPQTKAAMLLRLFGFNAKAAQYLTDEGLMALAREARGPAERRRAVQLLQAMKKELSNYKTVKTKDGREVLRLKVAGKEAASQAAANLEQEAEGTFDPGTGLRPTDVPQPMTQ
jgi:hypothetical protein